MRNKLSTKQPLGKLVVQFEFLTITGSPLGRTQKSGLRGSNTRLRRLRNINRRNTGENKFYHPADGTSIVRLHIAERTWIPRYIITKAHNISQIIVNFFTQLLKTNSAMSLARYQKLDPQSFTIIKTSTNAYLCTHSVQTVALKKDRKVIPKPAHRLSPK